MYTVLFAVTAFILYGVTLIFAGKVTLINHTDGENQYVLALIYYSEHLRSILSGLIHQHSLSIPEWEFAFGEGADIVGALSYYIIGSPLGFLCVFFKPSNMYLFYAFLIIFRLYLSGIAFMLLCREKIGKMSAVQAVTGALLYAFCGWGIENSLIWYNFLIPQIYLPLIILGVERVFKKKSPICLILSVMLLSLSNLYFLYMCGIIVAVHVIIKLVS